MTDMSILGRFGALLRSELAARVGVPWDAAGRRPGRRPADGEQGRGVRDATGARPASGSAGGRSVPPQDAVQARYYANLELPYGADIDAVREARRRLLKRYHPDLHSADPGKKQTATQLAQGLNHAHDELVSRLARRQR